jgi:hypothetical protein
MGGNTGFVMKTHFETVSEVTAVIYEVITNL